MTVSKLPFIAGHKFTKTGSLAHYGRYSNPPTTPILFALHSGLVLRQTAYAFQLHEVAKSEPQTEPFATGHIVPTEVVMLPETGVYDGLDIVGGVQAAQVLSSSSAIKLISGMHFCPSCM